MKTTVCLDHEPTPAGQVVRALLRIDGEVPAGDARVPLNLALVLDRSGSMAGENMYAARRAAAQLVRRLWPEDVVSVVAYDHEVLVVAEPGTSREQPDLPARIARLEARGSTNLSGGWLMGLELGLRRSRADGVNRIILLTDGLANEGITDREALVQLCARGRDRGVSTTTVGFGQDYDELLLRGMADAGGGNTHYIEAQDQAGDVFDSEIAGLLSLVAQNVSVTVEPAAGVSLTAVHHAYPRASTAAGIRLDVGDLYAREPKAVLIEFLLPPAAAGEERTLALVCIRAQLLQADGSVVRHEVDLPLRVRAGDVPVVDPAVRRELLLLDAACARSDALAAAGAGDLATAEERLRHSADRIIAAAAADPALAEEAADLVLLADRFAAREIDEADRKYLYQRAYATGKSVHAMTASIRRTKRRPK
jgi:Ca-activated chloride channel homolog